MAPSQEDPTAGDAPSSLIVGLRALRRRWPILLVALVLCVGITAVIDLRATKVYTATSTIEIGQSSNLAALIDSNIRQQPDLTPDRDVGNALSLVDSARVASLVRKSLKLPQSVADVQGLVVPGATSDSNLITLDVTDANPVFAARVANAFADQYAAYRENAARQVVADGAKQLQQQIASLPADDPQRQTLGEALQRVLAVRVLTQGDATVVSRATPPTAPSGPRKKRDILLAIVIGVVVGSAIVFLLELFDRRVRSVEELERLYGRNALAIVYDSPRDPDSAAEVAAVLEQFRILRDSLGFVSLGKELNTLLVTSAVPGEGKSTVASGLARAIALAGRRVVLVECDMRRPTFGDQFDLGEDRRGLSSALAGAAPARELVRRVLPELEGLRVLPAGPRPGNPAELLRSTAMQRVLRELEEDSDLVVLDAPPLLPVADSQGLLADPHVDAALIVARVNRVTRSEVERTMTLLERQEDLSVGLVVNGVSQRERGDYYGEA